LSEPFTGDGEVTAGELDQDVERQGQEKPQPERDAPTGGSTVQRAEDRLGDLAAGKVRLLDAVVHVEGGQVVPVQQEKRRIQEVVDVAEALDVRALAQEHVPAPVNLPDERVHVGKVAGPKGHGGADDGAAPTLPLLGPLAEDLLRGELGLAVRRQGHGGGGLIVGQGRAAIDRHRRVEARVADAQLVRHVTKDAGPPLVHVEKGRVGDPEIVVGRRQVQQAVRPLHRLAACVGIANVAPDEPVVGHAREGLDQVEDDDLVPVGREPLAEVRSDEAGSPRDAEPHGLSLPGPGRGVDLRLNS
jgi:hypothetical protein